MLSSKQRKLTLEVQPVGSWEAAGAGRVSGQRTHTGPSGWRVCPGSSERDIADFQRTRNVKACL